MAENSSLALRPIVSKDIASTPSAKFEYLTPQPDEDQDDITASWNLVINKFRETLSEFDFAELQRFPTPDKLLEDLKKKEPSKPHFQWVRRPIRTLRSFLKFFVVTMSPRNLESSIFWGLFYLLIELADSQRHVTNRWKDISEMVERVTRSLDTCKRTHDRPGMRFDDDMKFVLNDAFICLITLWAEAVKFMRDHPYDDIEDMQTRFDKAIRKVDESFNYLKICAEMRETNAQRHSVSGVVAFESLLPDGISLPCGEAPYYDEKDFFGREDVLKQIDSSLDPQSSQGQKFVTIFGLGGVGKSKVTLAYAKKYGFRFDVSLWIKSQTQISLRQSFTGIALELQIPGADQNGKGDENRNVVFDYLKKYCKSCLIIWDNVETQYLIRPYLSVAPASASMLVTTRYPEEAILLRSRGPIIHLQPFSAPEAALFFTQLLGTDYVQMQDLEDRKATEILLGKMAGLAIGICTMAIRIKAKGLSVRSFLNRYRKGTLVSKRAELADYDLTLESIWDESFSSMKSEEDEGENKGFSMLGVLMFCSSDRISKDLFVRPSVNGLADFPKFCQDSDALSLPCALGLEWELKLYRYLEAMDPLRKHGLITADQDFRVVAIHRLVQSALRKFLGLEASQACFNLAARLVHRAFPERIEGHSLHSQWEDCRSFIQHGVSLADIYEDSQSTPHPLSAPPEFTDLLKSCIWYLFEIGEHSESLRLSNVALKTTEKGTLIHAQLENSLYGLYSFQNDLGRARPLLESAYAFMKNHLGEDSAEYISPNMGNLLAAEGQTEAALEMFLIVEKRRNEIKKPQNIGLAFLNLGIGRAQMVMRNLEEAERRFKAAFKVVREEHGEKGQFMQDVFYAFGNLELQRANYHLAEELYSKSLSLQQAQNKSQVFNACILYKQACVRIKIGELVPASSLLDMALLIAISNGAEGEEARILFKKAQVLQLMSSTSDTAEIADLRGRARNLKEKVEENLGLPQRTDPNNTANEEEQYNKLVAIFHW